MPAISFRNVLLPDPFRPTRPTASPCSIAKRDVPQRPELFDRLAPVRVKQAEEADLQLDRRVVPEQELLRNRLRFDDRHYSCSVNRSSNARNSSAPTTNAPSAWAIATSHTVAVRPRPIEEDLLVRDDERRHRAQQDQQPQPLRHLAAARRRSASSRTARRARLRAGGGRRGRTPSPWRESARCRS